MNMLQLQDEARFLNIANQLARTHNCVVTFDLENHIVDFAGKKEDCENLAMDLCAIFDEEEIQ